MTKHEKMVELTKSPSAAILDALHGRPAETVSETCAALGVGYQLGNCVLPPVTLGILPLLEAIESPLLDDGVDRLSSADIMRACYLLAQGFRAVTPIMQMYRRKAALHNERERAMQNADLYAVYLDRVDGLERAWTAFDEAAASWWDTEVGGQVGLTDASEVLFRALNDALAGLSAIPRDAEKKTAGNSMRNGSRA